MRYYKIYAKAARTPKPIEELSDWEKDDLLNEAINYQYEDYLDSEGTTIRGNDETKQLLKMLNDEESDETKILNKIYEKIAELVIKEFKEVGNIPAGDWGLVALDDDESPWDYRPNAW